MPVTSRLSMATLRQRRYNILRDVIPTSTRTRSEHGSSEEQRGGIKEEGRLTDAIVKRLADAGEGLHESPATARCAGFAVRVTAKGVRSFVLELLHPRRARPLPHHRPVSGLERHGGTGEGAASFAVRSTMAATRWPTSRPSATRRPSPS